MASVVKKTISLPNDLAEDVERIAKEENKTVSAVIQEAIRLIKKEKFKKEFYEIQNFWTEKAKEQGILTEEDLERYLS
ncbi:MULTISPECIES: ribbon-helix-helix protein, CopG family [Thermodesulfovibrio]|jgi:predicted transcriptional regulator|uniref:ribbon-helix-helix protein, CopG family n=1 Tax=Thermodesulfovibrio TaxID=28261 RepID=UPI002635B681|nr:ribbon-helix-helix protein, CopG family [Thermodesulfovibrio sp.]